MGVLDQSIAILNGLVGDYLQREGNGLALTMSLRRGGSVVPTTAEGLRAAYPDATGRAVLLVHGIMCDETIFRFPDGTDYGSLLQQDLSITPFYLRFNTGLSISENGAQLDQLLEALVAHYPVALSELIVIGYSMGGLVVRSACHHASLKHQPWLDKVRRAIYVGTPHAGAPAERWGRLAAKAMSVVPDPVTQLIGQISDLRSAGMKDLGDADLRDEDRALHAGRLSLQNRKHPVPLLPHIEHSLIAGGLSLSPGTAALFGDGIVPVTSAQGYGVAPTELGFAADRLCYLPGRSHVDLPHDPEAYTFIKQCCEETP